MKPNVFVFFFKEKNKRKDKTKNKMSNKKKKHNKQTLHTRDFYIFRQFIMSVKIQS